MTTDQTNFDAYQGETKTLAVTITDDGGSPLDLTGLSAEWRLTTRVDPNTAVVTKTDGAGITITDAVAGKLEVQLDGSDTEIDPGSYRHELRLTGTGYVATVLAGRVTIRDSIFTP